jgi:hypothetical protein
MLLWVLSERAFYATLIRSLRRGDSRMDVLRPGPTV